jgi:hypothetical protein
MPIAQTLLPEFDREMANTRQMLALVPAAEAAWKPHPKSYALGDLAADGGPPRLRAEPHDPSPGPVVGVSPAPGRAAAVALRADGGYAPVGSARRG